MSQRPVKEDLISEIISLKKRIEALEKLLFNDDFSIKVGMVILTPQADAFFADSENSIEGALASKDSDGKVYYYTGSTWTALL